MDPAKKTANQIRPILQAMERSIDSARRRRKNGGDGAPQPNSPPAGPSTNGVNSNGGGSEAASPYSWRREQEAQARSGQNPAPSDAEQTPPAPARPKARPKRSTAFNDDPFNQQIYRPKAS